MSKIITFCGQAMGLHITNFSENLYHVGNLPYIWYQFSDHGYIFVIDCEDNITMALWVSNRVMRICVDVHVPNGFTDYNLVRLNQTEKKEVIWDHRQGQPSVGYWDMLVASSFKVTVIQRQRKIISIPVFWKLFLITSCDNKYERHF